jgi:hypothetical protein
MILLVFCKQPKHQRSDGVDQFMLPSLLVLKISSEISGEISVEDVVHQLAGGLHLGRGKEIGEEGRRSCSRLCPRIPAATLVLHASGHGLELLDALAEVLGSGIA